MESSTRANPEEKVAGSTESHNCNQDPIQRGPSKMVDTLTESSQSAAQCHAFWDTQPVPKLTDVIPPASLGPLDPDTSVDRIRKIPYNLPQPFRWVTCNIQNEDELSEIYTLLNENYVEDDDHMFRFDYSKAFLKWALCPPGYMEDWHVGIRTDKDKLVALITGIPCDLVVYGRCIHMAEINFLCVHTKLRSKRLAPVLIKEITRRVNLRGVWQAIYTAGIYLTKPVAVCTYYHRSLNIKKLVEVQFSSLEKRLTMSMAKRLYRLPEKTQIPGLRPMEENDVDAVSKLLADHLSSTAKIYPVFSLEEIKHFLLPREGVVVSYVRENEGQVTDFFSFYVLCSSILRHPTHKLIKAAYAFYTVAKTVPLTELMHDALIVARNADMDVFNCLNLNENQKIIEPLKFGKGDGSLKYYLYNYLCPSLDPPDLGLVLV